MSSLQTAIEVAVEGHKNQTDKSGDLYILHPMRVMGAFQDNSRRIVGILHDVIEDTKYEMSDLVELGFGAEIRDAVQAITKQDNDVYEDYLSRVNTNAIARDVKLADIQDNMQRLHNLPEADRTRLTAKYQKARVALGA